MIDAYVLVKVEAGSDEKILKQVRKMHGVKRAALTYGLYDLHVEVSFDTMEALDQFIFQEMRRTSGVKETATLISPKVK